MSMKLKVLGLGLLAVMAMSAVASVNASATVNGHFTHDASGGHALINGTETFANQAHRFRFQVGEGTVIECDTAHYTGTVNQATVTAVTVTPAWTLCHTPEGAPGSVIVHHEGCNLTFHSNSNASIHTPTSTATVTITCPVGKPGITITHPNCHITVPPQATNGITYTTTTSASGKHEITLNGNVPLTAHYEGGICIFLGTKQSATMKGGATVKGTDTVGNQVNITAT